MKYVIKVSQETIDAFEKTDIYGADGFRTFAEYLLTWPQTKEFLEIFIPQTTLHEAKKLFGGVEIVDVQEV